MLLLIGLACWGCGRKETDVQYGVMVLDVCGERKIENPTAEQIRSEMEEFRTKSDLLCRKAV